MSRRRRKRHQEEENHERWLVSYADFITLLFAFFVVLYATSERNSKKTQEFEKSIKKFFVNVAGVVGGGSEGTTQQQQRGNTLIKPPLPSFDTSSDAAKDAMGTVEVFLDENLSESERNKYLVDLTYDIYGVRLAIDGSQLFSKNSIKFNNEALKSLDTVSYMLKSLGNNIVVESHVNHVVNRPNPYSSDWKLSSARSTQVVEYMIKRHGFEADRLAAMAHGSERPLYPKGDLNEMKNQRIEFLVVTEKSPF